MGASDTRTLKVVVTGDSSSARGAIRDVGKEAEHSEGKFAKFQDRLMEWGTRGVVALGAVGGAAALMGIKTASETEQAQLAFTNMLGSGKKAKAFLDDLKDFAAKTPFEFPELVKSSQMLLAMGFNAKQVRPTLTAIGDAVAGMGGSQDQIEFVARALGQMQAKGKVAGDELLQLTEQGIPALKILADKYGVSTEQMSKMVEKGKVLSDKAIPALVDGLEKGTKSSAKFGGMMDTQSKTASGRWSTAMDTLHEGLASIAEKAMPQLNKGVERGTTVMESFFSGLEGQAKKGDKVGETVEKIVDTMGDMKEAFSFGPEWESHSPFEKAAVAARALFDFLKNPGIPTAQKIAAVLLQVGKVVLDLIGWFIKHKTVTETLITIIAALVVITKAHAVAMAIQSGALKKWILQTKIVQAATKAWAAVQWLLNAAMDANPIGIVIVVLAALAVALVYAYKHSDTFRHIVQTAWAKIKDAASATWNFLKGVFAALGKALDAGKRKFNEVKTGFELGWHAITDAFRTGVRFVVNLWLTAVGSLLHAAAKAFGWVPGIGPKLKSAARKFDDFKKDVNKSLGGISSRTVNVGVTFKAGSKLAYDARHQGLATGGPVKGPGTGTSDDIPVWLSNGEHVLTAAEVRAAGGHGAIMRWRKALRRASGGPIIAPHIPSHGSIVDTSLRGVLGAAQQMGSSLFGQIGATGSGVSRWAGLVLQVLGLLGQPAGLLAGVLRRIRMESGGNPNAINLWDSNAAAGHPSMGLMQVIQGTFNAFAGPFRGLGILNPLANIFAGLNYALHRYSSIGAIDPLVRPTGYDSGGVLRPGLTLAYNGTRKPEAIFTQEQLAGMGGVYIDKLIVEGNVHTEKDLVKAITVGVRDELLRHANRNGGRTGLPGK